jgi:hypothetical protein
LSEGEWALLEPDVLLPVEDVWPVTAIAVTSVEAPDASVVNTTEGGGVPDPTVKRGERSVSLKAH